MSGVIGLDLSLTGTGVALAHKGIVFDTDCIKTTGKKGDNLAERLARLELIRVTIMERAWGIEPDLAVIEAPSYGSKFGSQHDRSGLWWLVVKSLGDAGVPVATVSPNGRAKYGTGKGNAPKDEVLAAVVRNYPNVAVDNNNVADAVLLAAMGARHLGKPVEASLPKPNLAAMDGAAWPVSAS